jgi:tetratricopeptide (TPR) repeat protein
VATEDDMAFIYSNLALADMGLGRLRVAEPLFQQGLEAAIANRHRLHGPILTDLADLECRTGRYRAGLARLDEARPIVAARYPDDPWRTAHVDNVRAGCLTGIKRYADAARLMAASLPVVLKKWPAATLYGHDALERAVRLYAQNGDGAFAARYRRELGGN